MKKLPFIAPLLLTMASLTTLYANYVGTMSPIGVLRAFLFLCVLLVLLAVLLYWLLRDGDWTGIALAVLVIALFYSPADFKLAAVFMSTVFVLWCCSTLLSKRFRRTRVLTVFFAVGSALFLLLPLYYLTRILLLLPPSFYTAPGAGQPGIALPAAESKPDIYYIVLDGYARDDVLRDYYSFDNSEFTGYLRSRGFVIPENAHSNYAKTIQSVTSTLNMDYVQDLPPGLTEGAYWWLIVPYIDHSRLRATLEQQGYETYATATDWDITDNRTVDHYYSPYPLDISDFEAFFLNATPIGRLQGLISSLAPLSSYEAHRTIILNDFAALSEISRMKGPKFVFSHLIALHAPYVFDAAGNPLTPAYPFTFNDASDFPGDRAQYRDLYIGHVKFVNSRMRQVIDDILANSSTPPVIVLQADHGPGFFTDLKSSAGTCMRERFSVFAAYYLPGTQPASVPSDVTPVNIFRMVLGRYFHADLPALHNSSYFPSQSSRDYQFEDVTSRLAESCSAHPLP